MWESDGTEVTGQQFWLDQNVRNWPGNRIAYISSGNQWSWVLINDTGIERPFMCQISKEYVFKITHVLRGFDYGLDENDPEQVPRGPKFTVLPTDSIFDARSQNRYVRMNCDADGNPRPTYSWVVTRQLETKPINTSDPSITLTNGILTINEPTDSLHNGVYYCIASNSFGSIRTHGVQLSFGYLNDFPKSKREPIITGTHVGARIECIPPKTNYDNLVYSWYKNTPTNWIRQDIKWHTFVSADSVLYFQYVSKDDEGNYTCFVTTTQLGMEGKSSMPIQLKVTESAASTQDPIIVNGFPKAFPKSPLVGNEVKLECIAYATDFNRLTYTWSRPDGQFMPSGYRFQNDDQRVLVLSNIKLYDSGIYRCTASSQTGRADTKDVNLVVESAPYFTIPLEDQHKDLGSTVEWFCMSYGIPSVTNEWFINGTLLEYVKMPPDLKNRYSVSGNKLMISNITYRHAGMYQCSATNSHGTSFSSAQLRILAFAPSFKKNPVQPNVFGLLDGNVTMLCSPEASPPANKEWFKDGMALNPGTDPTSRIRMLPNGNLFIRQISSEDKGNYSCTAQNSYGTASSSGRLLVLPQFTIHQPPRDTVVLVNQTAFFHCEAAYNPAIDITYDWYHNSYKIMFIKVRNLGNTVHVFKEPYYERGTGIYRGSLYIYNVQFFHAGDYWCVVKSTTQSVRAKGLLVVEGPPGEPAGVLGSNVGPTNLTLTWWPGPDNGQKTTMFVVEALNTAEGFWRRVKIESRDTFVQNVMVSTIVDGLNPYTEYKFRVFGVNIYGEGVPSKNSPLYRTSQAPPVIYPLGLKGGGGKVGTLNITWEQVPLSSWNAEKGKVGYIVHWKRYDMNDDQWAKTNITDPMITKLVVLIGPQNFYMLYNLRIQFFNPMGVGPMSPQVNAMSAEDLPTGVPISVRAVYANATAITVEWLPVANTREVMRGVLLGYRINYWVDKEEDEQMGLFRIIRNNTDNGLIIALRENTDYMINVQAVNTAGNGPKSENYRTKTLRAAPKEAPQQVTVSMIDEQSVQLHWRGVYTTIEEEPLEGYIVRYWRRGENIYVAKNVDAGKQIRYILSGLEQYVQYELRVYGYSRGGDGLQSSPTLEFIIGDKAQILQDSPDKQYIVSGLGYIPFIPSECSLLLPKLFHNLFIIAVTFLLRLMLIS
ncbi:hypothetical protein HELRODRAFT_185513 [Helobdella robusta]|uniref:Contactin n=1 Tax=Helobdella robusta TaxID=6412 RepID=T1FMX1_HELRO|nr:hypothetical protein HELRODRAFT_185513 [Helobdella robusta]ESO05253.1 hypothetical protein HELRODRAFT_185513 [Helobdella robusta]